MHHLCFDNVLSIRRSAGLRQGAFRKRIRDSAFLEEIPGALRHGSNRPAQLYRRAGDTVHFSRTMTGRT